MYDDSARPRQVFFSVALSAAAIALAGPPSLHWSSSPSPVAAVLREPAPAAAMAVPQAFASYRSRVRPSFPVPTPSATIPRVSDDLAAARLIPSPPPSPAPVQTAQEATQAPPAPSPSPYPTYSSTPTYSGTYGSAQAYAESLVGAGQFACLKPLWDMESGWNPYAQNPSSGAYGIPQALPGSKMASAGPDWATNPDTQVRWGISYINGTYGSPCGAWSHEQSYGWY